MTEAESAYASALVKALTRDLIEYPVAGRVARVVIRWFASEDPLCLTVHALGTDEESELGEGDAWYPLEWPNVDREMERTDRLVEDRALAEAAQILAPQYEDFEEAVGEEWRATPALIEAARRVPQALRDAGLELADHMAAAAAHFEGGGARYVLQQIYLPEPVMEALRERDELPEE